MMITRCVIGTVPEPENVRSIREAHFIEDLIDDDAYSWIDHTCNVAEVPYTAYHVPNASACYVLRSSRYIRIALI